MNLILENKTLNSAELILKTERLVREERRIIVEVLQCLREIEKRMLYAEIGFGSLYEFCVKHLQYSEGSAHRRISAMRLLRDLPAEVQGAVETKMQSGELSVTNLSSLNSFFKIEKNESGKSYSPEEKLEMLQSIEKCSKREVEKKLAQIQPKILVQESHRILTESLTEIRFVADEELIRKLNRIREISANTTSRSEEVEGSYAKILNRLADEYLKRHDPLVKAKRAQVNEIEKFKAGILKESPTSLATKRGVGGRYIPSVIRHQVWIRDEGKCTYVSPETKTKCNSRYGLEVDHIEPFIFGGKHELSNLRLLCRQHNQFQANRFGLNKLESRQKAS